MDKSDNRTETFKNFAKAQLILILIGGLLLIVFWGFIVALFGALFATSFTVWLPLFS